MAAIPNPFRLSRPATAHQGPALAGVGSRYLSNMVNVSDPLMLAWRPQLREAQVDTQEAWMAATAQTIDALHTNGWMAGGVLSARGQILFQDGLRLNLKPWGNVVSSDPKTQAAWARDVEGRFHVWASSGRNVDWGGRYDLAQLAGQALNQYFATGEIVATLPYVERPGTSHGTKVSVLPSQRLSQANGPGSNVIQGVEIDAIDGSPQGYHFNRYNYATGQTDQHRVAAHDAIGRPQVIHLLDNGPSAVRGITPFAPALRVVRQSDQLANATLTGSLMQTIFSATVESESPTEDLLRALQGVDEPEDVDDDGTGIRPNVNYDVEGVTPGSFTSLLGARLAWYKNTNIDLGRFGKIAHLFPGEKLKFNRPEHPSTDYKNFQRHLLLEVARCMTITYYQLTGDFDGFTYTTAKMAVDEIWPGTLWRRAMLARFYQTVFEAWLEEDIRRGYTVIPGGIEQFYAQRQFICRADWRGPPRPTADDLKTAKAKQVERAEGWSSTEGIASEYGNDWVEVADSQAASDEYRVEKKLPILPSIGGGGNGAGSAAVAGDDPKSEASQDREARLVGAMMRGDESGVDAVLQEDEDVKRSFIRYAATTVARHSP